MQYAIGTFTRNIAAEWSGKTVNLTTRPGDKTGEGNESYTGVRFQYVPGNSYALLAKSEGDRLTAAGAVFLTDIATIEEASK